MRMTKEKGCMLNSAEMTGRSMSLQQNQPGKIVKFMSLQQNHTGRKGRSVNHQWNQTGRKGRFMSHQKNQLEIPTTNRPRISLPRHLRHQRRPRRRGARRRRHCPLLLLQVWTNRPQLNQVWRKVLLIGPKPKASPSQFILYYFS